MDLEVGTAAAREANPMMQFYFTMKTRGLGRLIIGNKDKPRRTKKKRQVLTSPDVSSLVIGRLRNQAIAQSTTTACFYFDFASEKKEQSCTNTQRAPLKQLVC